MECIVHIGHGKTGTSFIQTMLALCSERLNDEGYIYPSHQSMEKAKQGFVTSGNGTLLLDSNFMIRSPSIFSNEILFRSMANDDSISELLNRLSEREIKLKVVMYTRDFFDHAISNWGQYIKRGKGVYNYNEFLKEIHGNHLNFIEYWQDASLRLEFDLSIFNYSRHKSKLWNHFCSNVLRLGEDRIPTHSTENVVVNRSLSMSEYEIQRLFNKYCRQASSPFVSDVLVDKIPEVKSEYPFTEFDSYDFVLDKYKNQIERINDRIEDGEKILLEPFELINQKAMEINKEKFSFSQKQLEILIAAVALRLNDGLKAEDAYLLRDIALKIEKNDDMELSDALALMSVAQRANPHGPFIRDKVEQYRSNISARVSDPEK